MSELPSGYIVCRNCQSRAFRAGETCSACGDIDEPVVESFEPWSIEVVVDWMPGMSKNRMWRPLPNGGMSMTPEGREARQALADATTAVLLTEGIRPHPARRIKLGIHVRKPSPFADAINVLDQVADAVELSTGVDDSLYEVDYITWDVAAEGREPGLDLVISQQ